MKAKTQNETVCVSEATVQLYESVPADRWVLTTELDDTVDLTSRGVRHALDKLENSGVIKKENGSPGIAGKVTRRSHNKVVKSYKKQARQEPASFHMSNGYEVSTCSLEQSDAIAIHRLVAVAEYGIDAVGGAHVHHINSIPWDNRPSNLTPLSPSQHHTVEALRKSIEKADDETLARALETKGYTAAATEVRDN